MKTIARYQCEVCGYVYDTEEAALACEQRPVVHDRGVKIGDTVRITRGDGTGSLAEVYGISILHPGWGPTAYDHSVCLNAKVINSWGSRMLAFDSYEVVS